MKTSQVFVNMSGVRGAMKDLYLVGTFEFISRSLPSNVCFFIQIMSTINILLVPSYELLCV